MKKLILTICLIASMIVVSGCMNMPTPVSQITGIEVSTLQYEAFDCDRLALEDDFLAKRESQLVVAQTQRIKTSRMQAFWWGFGQGDGMEASELANVRGQRMAIHKVMRIKNCK